MLEEDMKTHLLLSHLENNMQCPLCSLSGVSYDELCFHISSAHPEKQHRAQDPAHLTSTSDCSAGTHAGVSESETPQTASKSSSLSRSAGDSCDTASEAAGASSVTTDSVQPKQDSTPESGGLTLTSGKTASITSTLTTRSPKTIQGSFRHCNEDDNGIKSDHSKAKQKRLSSPRKGDLAFSNCIIIIIIIKFTIDLNCPVLITEKLFPCPMCELVYSNCSILQEHVELHLQEQHSGNFSASEICIFCSCVQATVFNHWPLLVISTRLICRIQSNF